MGKLLALKVCGLAEYCRSLQPSHQYARVADSSKPTSPGSLDY